MSPSFYLMSIFVPVGAIVAIVALRSWSAAEQARARLANDDAYRQLAQAAAAAQSETVTALAALQETLAEVRARLAAVEKVLRDVG